MLKAASSALTQWRFDPPAAAPAIARVSAQFDLSTGQATTGPAAAISGFSGAPGRLGTFVARRDAPPASDDTLRVGGQIRAPQKVVNVAPVYPQEAQDAGVQGVVIIEAKIGADGSVAEAWVVRSIPMLDQAALDAVRQWRYSPTLLNGAPVPVIMTTTVNFTLADRRQTLTEPRRYRVRLVRDVVGAFRSDVGPPGLCRGRADHRRAGRGRDLSGLRRRLRRACSDHRRTRRPSGSFVSGKCIPARGADPRDPS